MAGEDSEKLERVRAYLESHNTLTLATARDGVPFACSLFYASDGLALYFVSETKSRHAENIAGDPQVAVTISEDHREWRAITGIQLDGRCTMLNPTQTARALVLYAKKFPFVAQLGGAMAKVKFYKITPRWVRFIDNTRGFGFKEEIELA